MTKTRIALSLAAALSIAGPLVAEAGHIPVSDWKHSDERVRKAEQKRVRRAAKRLAKEKA